MADISAGVGFDFVEWIETASDFFPGFGMSARIEALWRPIPSIGVGIQLRSHYSWKDGGPYPSEPDRSLRSFVLWEADAGLTVAVFF